MKSVGRIFLTGTLTVLPVLATLYLVVWLVTAAERFVGKQLMWLIPDEYYRTGMGLVLALLLIFAVGLLMHALLFRQLFGWAERLLLEIPLLRSVYGALRDLFGLFAGHKGSEAMQVVSVTLPGSGSRALGFVTRADFSDLPHGIGAPGEIAVYLPMSYQIGGYTLFMQRDQAVAVDMSREAAMKFILTAGLRSGNGA
ncbi:MAG: DUF502 domain-containing protein [Proteobacteria bacterium]|nr:DUF502 domain-containing protein [Pseudomonadota bacterium]